MIAGNMRTLLPLLVLPALLWGCGRGPEERETRTIPA